MTMMGTEQLMTAVSGLFLRDDLFGVEVSAEISNASGASIQPPGPKSSDWVAGQLCTLHLRSFLWAYRYVPSIR
jgi:hypothetical protein